MDARTLLKETRTRLRRHRGKYSELARANPDLSLSWVSQVARGKIDNPTVDSLQQLIEALDDFEGKPKPVRIDTPEAVAAVLPAARAEDQPPAEQGAEEDPDASRYGPAEETA